MLYLFLRRFFVGPLVKLLFRPKVTGLENIPATGPALLVSNHLAFCDSIFLPVAVPRQIVFPAKSEYFTAPGLKGKLVATFFRSVGQIPIDRSGGRASLAALNTGLEILEKGELFGIYPEGTRSPDGRLYKGKTGVARMAIVAGVPVIPVAMIDTEKLHPPGTVWPTWLYKDKGRRLPRLIRPGVAFGKPLLLPLRGDGARPVRPALGHRRDHVRADGAVRPGVRRHVRRQGQGAHQGRRQRRRTPPPPRHQGQLRFLRR